MADIKVISADSHADEPASLLDQLPEEYQHKRPRIDTIDGDRYLMFDGWPPFLIDPIHPLTEADERGSMDLLARLDDVGVGEDRDLGLDIENRIMEIEQDGVTAEVIYPNQSLQVGASPDAGFQVAITRLYNDFYADHFGGHSDRFVPSAVIPIIDIDASVEEVRRVAKLGFRSMSVSVSRPQRPYNWPVYEPFWTAVEKVGIPLSFHVFSPGEPFSDKRAYAGLKALHGEDLSVMLLGMAEAMSPLSLLTASGVLERHPDLKFVLVECGTGWPGRFTPWTMSLKDGTCGRSRN
ncbi:MAG: amidohydrolase family protein [Dehalococcoidia bacterium]